MARFRAVGKLSVGDNFVREGVTKNGIPYKSVNIRVSAADNNTAFVELFGMKNDPIKTKDGDGNSIEIAYADRNDADIIDSVANYRKHYINLGDDRNTFISDYDAVNFIIDNIDKIKDSKVIITGQLTSNVYQGKVSHRFQLQNLYLANEDEKPGIKITSEFFFDKDSLDGADFKEDKKIYINGYVQDWFGANDLGTDKGGNRYVAQQGILDCSKIDFENEKHVKLLNFKLAQLGIVPITSALDKIKSSLKKGYYSLNVEFNYQNGAEAIEFDESQLTDLQKEMVELGLKKIDDFRPAGQAYGDRVTLWKITNFPMTGKYEDGMLEANIDEDEFFKPVASEGSLAELEDKAGDLMDFTQATEDLDDLFD